MMAFLANAMQKKDAAAIQPRTFHPFAPKVTARPRQATQADLEMLFGGPT